MVRVIVNADDIGMTAGVTRGITKAVLQGVVTSASFMATMPDSEDAASQIIGHGLDVGVHLNITQGRPLMQAGSVPSLTDEKGSFWSASELRARLRRGLVSLHEIETEFARQIERTIELGISPTHLDTHHHMHASLGVAKALCRVALRYDIQKVRTLRTLETLSDVDFAALEATVRSRRSGRRSVRGGLMKAGLGTPLALLKPGAHVEDWVSLFERLAPYNGSGAFEIICHPAEADDDLRRLSTFVASREAELGVLTSSKLVQAVADLGIELITFRGL